MSSKGLRALERVRWNLNNRGTVTSLDLDIIETALKNYVELTSKPAILYGRTHGHTQALIDTICKNYKEVKITNLEDEKKLKALEIIKKLIYIDINGQVRLLPRDKTLTATETLSQDKQDLLKEVLL